MTMDQVDSEDLFGVMANEQGRKVRNMFVRNRRLITITKESVIPRCSQFISSGMCIGILTGRSSYGNPGLPEPCQGREGWYF